MVERNANEASNFLFMILERFDVWGRRKRTGGDRRARLDRQGFGKILTSGSLWLTVAHFFRVAMSHNDKWLTLAHGGSCF
jgi:hypothetical protein